jgi:hypothetical protein
MIRSHLPPRRYLHYGFSPAKDSGGQPVGAAVLRLARRNAYERIGLKRPAATNAWRWKVG